MRKIEREWNCPPLPPSPISRACILACLLNLRDILTIWDPGTGYKRPGRDLMSGIGSRPMRTAIKQARCSWTRLYFKLSAVLMRDVSNDFAPPIINGMFTLSSQVHNSNTRSPSAGNVRLEGRCSSYHPFKVQCHGNYLVYRNHQYNNRLCHGHHHHHHLYWQTLLKLQSKTFIFYFKTCKFMFLVSLS